MDTSCGLDIAVQVARVSRAVRTPSWTSGVGCGALGSIPVIPAAGLEKYEAVLRDSEIDEAVLQCRTLRTADNRPRAGFSALGARLQAPECDCHAWVSKSGSSDPGQTAANPIRGSKGLGNRSEAVY